MISQKRCSDELLIAKDLHSMIFSAIGCEQFFGQVHNAELAETAEPAEQDSSARLNSALFTGVLGKSP